MQDLLTFGAEDELIRHNTGTVNVTGPGDFLLVGVLSVTTPVEVPGSDDRKHDKIIPRLFFAIATILSLPSSFTAAVTHRCMFGLFSLPNNLLWDLI